jgi:hypothetical protein
MIQIPRKVLTLDEVRKRWNVPPLDVQRAVMDGYLRPCVMLDQPLTPVVIVDGVATVLPGTEPVPVHRYVFHCYEKQIGPFDFRTEYVCDMAKPVEGSQIWLLPAPVTLVDLMSMAVVTAEDLADAEEKLRPVRDEDSLTGKERNSISIVVSALAFQAYGWSDDIDKYVGIADLQTEIEALGMRLSPNTIKAVVSDCWKRAKPAVCQN